jgi:hypothetical protein
MFSKEFTFYGSHAEQVKGLATRAGNNGVGLFHRNVDVLLFAPIVGFLFNRRSEPEKKRDQATKIFVEQMIKEDKGIRFNYQLITLLDDKFESDRGLRIDCAFRTTDSIEYQAALTRYQEYILGGIEILHEKTVRQLHSGGDILGKLYDFLEDIHDRFNETIDGENLSDLIAIARE